MIGIYGIKNKVNGKIYVGQSKNINFRYNRHIRELKNNIHYNQKLQRSFIKHGQENFKLIILEECSLENLCCREQYWIDSYNKKNLYNINYYVNDLSGDRNPFFGKTHTEETKKKLREIASKNNKGFNNPNFGNKYSLETKIKCIINKSTTKLSIQNVLEIVELLKFGEDHQSIADKFNICRTAITRISNGKRWANITGGPVIPLIYENGKRIFTDLHKRKIGMRHAGKTISLEHRKK